MDLATFKRESTLNREAYQRMQESIRSRFTGKYVAMAHGEVVGTAATFDEAVAHVEKLNPMPEYYNVFSADDEPDFGLNYDLFGGH